MVAVTMLNFLISITALTLIYYPQFICGGKFAVYVSKRTLKYMPCVMDKDFNTKLKQWVRPGSTTESIGDDLIAVLDDSYSRQAQAEEQRAMVQDSDPDETSEESDGGGRR